MLPYYDVIVVGAGHAGCEAAAAAANLGSKTLLITMDMTKYAQMSCNPAIGGIAKGQIVREIDALGGYTGIVTDKTSIQFRMLNRSKGPAMWSPRAQSDRMKFSEEWRFQLENIKNLDFWQDTVIGLIIENEKAVGVKTKEGIEFKSKSVILTNGTFLNGLIHIGRSRMKGGRIGEEASYYLSDQMKNMGFNIGRMKTGTPVRVDGRTVDFSKMIPQEGDNDENKFSYLPEIKSKLRQRRCWITYTNKKVHEILRLGFKDSPLFNGTIKSKGPRYCPSIETKLMVFSGKDQHQLFLEPEGENTVEYYLNGYASSLPWDIQYEAMKLIPGLENAKIFRPGYAIEYDYFDPTQIYHSLESKIIKNLFLAGQINGTTGYEEAAAQGIMAGINAHRKINELSEFVLKRDEAYIGVLIDDLVTKGVDEPYRMFTSRAEYRILLRQDDADIRLTPKSHDLGLASDERMNLLNEKLKYQNKIISFVNEFSIKPKYINDLLIKKGTTPLKQGLKLKDVITRPQIRIFDLIEPITPFKNLLLDFPKLRLTEFLESAEILIKYKGYIDREEQNAQKFKRLENIIIEDKFDYSKIKSISTEGRQKLEKINPKTIGQASRIPGISPSDINVLLIMMGR